MLSAAHCIRLTPKRTPIWSPSRITDRTPDLTRPDLTRPDPFYPSPLRVDQLPFLPQLQTARATWTKEQLMTKDMTDHDPRRPKPEPTEPAEESHE